MPKDVVLLWSLLMIGIGIFIGFVASVKRSRPQILDMSRLQDGEAVLLSYEGKLSQQLREELRQQFKRFQNSDAKLLILEGECKALIVKKDGQVVLN